MGKRQIGLEVGSSCRGDRGRKRGGCQVGEAAADQKSFSETIRLLVSSRCAAAYIRPHG